MKNQQTLISNLPAKQPSWSGLPLFSGEPVVVANEKFVESPAQMSMFGVLGKPDLGTMGNVKMTDLMSNGQSSATPAPDLEPDGQPADDDTDDKNYQGGDMVYLSIQDRVAPNGKPFQFILLIWGEYVGTVGMSGEFYGGDKELWANVVELQRVAGLITTSGPMSATYYHLPQATIDMVLQHKAVLIQDGIAQPYQHFTIKDNEADFGATHQGYESYGRLVNFSYVDVRYGAVCQGKGEIIYFDYQPRLTVSYVDGQMKVTASNVVCATIDYQGSFYTRRLSTISHDDTPHPLDLKDALAAKFGVDVAIDFMPTLFEIKFVGRTNDETWFQVYKYVGSIYRHFVNTNGGDSMMVFHHGHEQ